MTASPDSPLPSDGQPAGSRGAGSFDDDWLDLREAVDHRSRAVAALERQLPRRDRWRALDLGGGTGSNLRYLMPRLGGRQHWWLIDNDPRLLAAAGQRLVRWAADQGFACAVDGATPGPSSPRRWTRIDIEGADWQATIEPRRIDLERPGFLSALAGDDEAIDLVTASALLDLVSLDWLATLVDWCARQRVAMLISLSYDGRVEWSPVLPDDVATVAALERDQRRDKGMGLALGSEAVSRLRARLAARGLREVAGASDWDLGASGPDAAIQRRLIGDWAALTEPAVASRWQAARVALLEAGQSRLRVGHLDVAAWPAGLGDAVAAPSAGDHDDSTSRGKRRG